MIVVARLQNTVDKPQSFFTHVQLLARKKEDEKFQQTMYVSCKLEKCIYLLNVRTYVFDNVFAVKLIFIVL